VGSWLDPLEAAGVVTGVLGVWLTVRQSLWCWPVSLLNVSLYAIVFFRARLYADVGLQAVFFVLCALGWWRWLHPGPAREELPVSRIAAHVFEVGERSLSLACTIGLAETGPGTDRVEGLIKDAEHANQRGRKRGGNQVVLEETSDESTRVQRFDAHRFYLTNRMAISAHHFRLTL